MSTGYLGIGLASTAMIGGILAVGFGTGSVSSGLTYRVFIGKYIIKVKSW